MRRSLLACVVTSLPVIVFACDNDTLIADQQGDAAGTEAGTEAAAESDTGAGVETGTADASSDADADAGPETVASVVTSRWQTCFVMSTGRLFCAGKGDLKPKVVAGITDAVEITFGGYGNGLPTASHACIRRKAGTVSCWGANNKGQLGDGATGTRTGIVDVVGITNAVQIVGGGNEYTCARLATGSVVCWGEDSYGSLGNGIEGNKLAPTAVSGLTDAAEINGSCARRVSGQVVCWGHNHFGDLGDGRFDHEVCAGEGGPKDCSRVPVPVTGLADAKSISGTSVCKFALRTDGSVVAWGTSMTGALGDGVATHTACPGSDCAPEPVSLGITALEISGNLNGACVRLASGVVKCWGSDSGGQLGNGDPIAASNVPVDVAGVADALQIVRGHESACAVRPAGRVSCWGRNESGSLAIGSTTLQVTSPVDVKW